MFNNATDKVHIMSKNNKGFSLIELMIVMAIIGILAAIALPAYQTYTKRSHIAEGLSLANGTRVAITDYYSTFGSFPADNAAVGIVQASSIQGNAVRSIAINFSTVVITYNTKVASGATILLESEMGKGVFRWRCTGGDVPREYRPSNCR